MSFLPEDDQEFLARKELKFELQSETLPDQSIRRGILFPAFEFESQLLSDIGGGSMAPCKVCQLVIVIPKGYATTRLDSFYTLPILKRPDKAFPDCAATTEVVFGQTRQFWSRHLTDADWRVGVDGLETYLLHVRDALRKA